MKTAEPFKSDSALLFGFEAHHASLFGRLHGVDRAAQVGEVRVLLLVVGHQTESEQALEGIDEPCRHQIPKVR